MVAAIPPARPPGPRNPPIVGQLASFRRDALGFLTRMSRDFGDIAYFRLGPQHVYAVSHPDFVREILMANQHNFTKSRALQRARILLGNGLLTSEGADHLRQRRLVQPAFHRPRLAGYAQTMSEYAVAARERWHDGETLDIDREMMRLTLAIVGKTLFSADIEHGAEEIGEALNAVVKMFRILMLPFSEWLERLPLPQVKRFERAEALLNRTIYGMIEERRRTGRDYGDLLSMLLLAQDEEDGGGMTDKQVRDEALTLFLAGHETTATALTWTWYLLSQNPEAERRLHEEIDRVLNGRVPGFDDLPELRYTEMVLAESMRLFPPVWAIGRKSIEAFEMGGYEIPAKSVLIVSQWVTHHDRRWYDDPARFDPERWRPEARESRPKFSYFPFGGGTRVCIGERFAWMEGTLLLAAIAQRWRFRLAPGHRVETWPLITLRTRHGMRMVGVKREVGNNC